MPRFYRNQLHLVVALFIGFLALQPLAYGGRREELLAEIKKLEEKMKNFSSTELQDEIDEKQKEL